jgi:hypothetical protein
MTLLRCPQCNQPAEITHRFTLASTDGPADHVKTMCAAGHWFTLPAADVEVLPVEAEVSAGYREAA